jgi:hypothetical protein
MRRFVTGLLILISALCLFLSSTSLWVRHNVINTQVFVSNVDAIVDLPQVQARVNDQVTTTVMANPQVQGVVNEAVAVLPPRLQQFRPTVENGVRSLVSAGVQRLLTNQPFRPLRDAALTSAHDQLVNGQPVRFTLGQAKARVPASVTGGLAGQVLALLPNDLGVTLITPADAPRLYNAIDLLESAWWWLGLVFLAALAGALGISRRRRGTLRAWAVTTAVLAFVGLLALRVSRGQILVQVKPENRDAVSAVYDVLAGSLRSWTLWLLVIALVVLAFTLLWGHVGLIPAVRRGAASARESVQRRREARAAAAAATAEGANPDGVTPDGATPDGATSAPVAGESVAEESWPRRVAAEARAFVAGMDLDRRAAALGAYVDAHFRAARWTGIVLGAVVLLLWPAPTLSVLIWIVAVIALYVAALDWLRSKAPRVEAREGALEEIAAVEEQAVERTDADSGVRAPIPSLPVARAPVDGVLSPALVPAGGAPGAASAVPAPAAVAAPPAAPPREFAEPVLKPEVVSSLNGRLDLLVRLGQAHDAGVLTDEEFDQEKSRLLEV